MNAGELRELLDFQQRGTGDDGFGNQIPGAGPWATTFTTAGAVKILKGTETVMAGRLAGKQTLLITVRWQPSLAPLQNAAATTVRIVDKRTGIKYRIISVEPDARKQWVQILAEKGIQQ